MNGVSYSKLVNALKRASVQLDRKILADLAVSDPGGFKAVVDAASAVPRRRFAAALQHAELAMAAVDAVAAFEAGLAHSAAEYRAAFDAARDEHALRAANARFVGPNGELTRLMKRMPELPGDAGATSGKRANELKNEIQAAFQARLAALAQAAREAELSGPHLDVSLPGRGRAGGAPASAHARQARAARRVRLDGLRHRRRPRDRPARVQLRQARLPEGPPGDRHAGHVLRRAARGRAERSVVLRTHTSTIQVREMLRRKPPLAVVSAGASFRRDDDATHSPMFMQLEGFMVDEGISFAHLKGVLTHFLQRLFGRDVPVRFRPSYFPFVEPGGEVDVGCTICRRWQLGGAALSASAASARTPASSRSSAAG